MVGREDYSPFGAQYITFQGRTVETLKGVIFSSDDLGRAEKPVENPVENYEGKTETSLHTK